MRKELEIARQQVNWARYQPGQAVGHYESFFQRANHPTRPMAFWTPFMTVLVLRHRGEEIALNHLTQAIRVKASIQYFNWNFRSETNKIRLEEEISASQESFVGLRYNRLRFQRRLDVWKKGFRYCPMDRIVYA